jgi:hypothetical protein
MRKPLEKDVVKACLQYLRLVGVFAWRQNQGAVKVTPASGPRRFFRFASAEGISDIIGVLPGGRLLAVECKREDGKVRESQERFLSAVRAKGGLALVVRSVTELIAAIEGSDDAPQVVP